MSQTGVIFFALFIGFVVFITVRGQLNQYLAVIGLADSSNLAGISKTVGAVTGAVGSTVGRSQGAL